MTSFHHQPEAQRPSFFAHPQQRRPITPSKGQGQPGVLAAYAIALNLPWLAASCFSVALEAMNADAQ